MTEQELRAIVRAAIARHGRLATAGADHADSGAEAPPLRTPMMTPGRHPSHGLFSVPAGADTDGPCIIEPAVPCNHCGYCKSYGH